MSAAVTPSALGKAPSWPNSATSARPATPAFDTSSPAAVETISPGICETSPSPIVRSV
jgi:hypothetical protein